MIENKNLISSYEFAKISDQIFSGVFTQSQLNELLIKNYKIVQSDDNFLYIRNLKFEIKENDIYDVAFNKKPFSNLLSKGI